MIRRGRTFVRMAIALERIAAALEKNIETMKDPDASLRDELDSKVLRIMDLEQEIETLRTQRNHAG